jgi:hypothetical protein
MTGGMPDSKADDFSHKYIMIVRNPMTMLPYGYNAKAIKYSGTVGQLPQEEWRRVRDEWFDGMMESWKKLIISWKSTKYEVGMYFVYEDLFQIETGIETMKAIRLFLQQEGFQVVSEDELGCIWFDAIGKDDLERYRRNGYEYDGYIPGYTMEQKDKMLNSLREIKDEFQNDAELVVILDRYMKDIDRHMRIE